MDGLLGVEEEANLKHITRRLRTKWKYPYSRTCGYVKSRFIIKMVRETHCCIQGYRLVSNRISVKRTQWEYRSGINIF